VGRNARRAPTFFLVVCLVLAVCRVETGAAQKHIYITVAAGTLDRQETVVSFALPKNLEAKSYGLRDEAGSTLPLQIGAGGEAAFVLPEMKAGATKSYRLEELKSGAHPARAGAQSTRERNRLTINAAGRRALDYQAEPGELPRPDIRPVFRRGGYIHPVYTPSGRIVTDDYPADHLHHHGIWFAWTMTEFDGRKPDFWNMGDGTGAIEFQSLDRTWSGPVHAGFKARHRHIDLSGPEAATVLNEVWEVMVYNVGKGRKPFTMFDLVSTQECATSLPLVLPEYRYGGIGFRGHGQWLGKENALFLTSEGKDRANGHATRARWCYIGGRIDGQLAGIAILGHPGNFRAPQPMRIHPTEPFFCFAPSQMGRWEIVPGAAYVSRYRFIVFDGPPEAARLDRLWNDYANPPVVSVTLR
jgi:hypothetical protein